MKFNHKILIYDLLLALFVLVFSWGILGLVLFRVVNPYDKVFMIITGAVMVTVFILNIFWFFKTKETKVGVINILVPLVLAVIIYIPVLVLFRYNSSSNLVLIASIFPFLIGARFHYNIGFYFKMKNRKSSFVTTPLTMHNFDLVMCLEKLFTYLPTMVLCIATFITLIIPFAKPMVH